MARTQMIQWVSLPNGLADDGRLKLSVFVAPRLRSDEVMAEGVTLAQFPDFVDWAARVGSGEVQFEIEHVGGDRLAPEIVSAPPDAALWRLLFGTETPLRPFEFDDYADRPLVSFPVVKLLDYFKERYALLAADTLNDLPLTRPSEAEDRHGLASLEEHFKSVLVAHGRLGVFRGDPPAEELAQRIGQRLRWARADARARREAFSLVPQPRIDPFALPNDDGPAGYLYQAQTFHRGSRLDPVAFPQDADEARRHFEKQIDFHQLLSSLADYPLLLRRLGLVFDLLLPADALTVEPAGAAPGQLRTHATFTSAFPQRDDPDQTPWTLSVAPSTSYVNTELNGMRLFAPAPRGGLQDSIYRLAQLNPQQFQLVQVDVDGLALKVSSLLPSLRRQIDNPNRPIDEPDRSGAPTVRTGGLGLIHTGRADALHNDFYQARGANHDLETDPNNPPNPPQLAAEELTRGVRVDIYDDQTQSWHSLHARRGDYAPTADPIQGFDGEADEGFFQVGLAGDVGTPATPADPDGELYVHESLVTWDGWSLSVPRPGDKVQQEPPPPDPAPTVTPLPLNVRFSVEAGSLPRLRFGRGYALRMRTVDLAGNSLTLSQADSLLAQLRDLVLPGVHPVTAAGQYILYRRFEPVPPPELVARRRFREAEGVERLVIRSDYDVSSTDYPAAFANAYPDVEPEPGNPYVPYCDRFVAAPKASLQLVETHGLFDGMLDAARAQGPAAWQAAVAESYEIAARESGSFREAPGAHFVTTGTDQAGAEQGYAVIDADEVELPYLPDPLSTGVLLRFSGLPDQPDVKIVVRFQPRNGWYDLRPFRIRLEEGNTPPQFDQLTGVLTVQLSRGRTASCRLNSLFENDLNLLGILGWCEEVLAPHRFDNVARAVEESRHWMVTPWRDLTFVHAVQHPLVAPELRLTNLLDPRPIPLREANILSRNRKENQTGALLCGEVFLDGPSTAQFDLVAGWREPQDDPSLGRPLYGQEMLQLKKTVMTLGIPESGQNYEPDVQAFLSFQDDQLVLFNSFVGDEDATMRQMQLQERLKPPLDLSQSEAEKNSLRQAIVQVGQLQAHEFGDTRYRQVDYWMVAASRFREYFAPELGEHSETISRAGSSVTVHVLSSARPAKPAVTHTVPLMRWEETGEPDSAERSSTRHGAGVRVWLERPWFSSGAGELLGVVFEGMILSASDPLYPYVTLWGQDPIHASALPPGPRLTSFPNAQSVVRGLNLPEISDRRVNVALFEPVYDADLDRWFCDIELDTDGAYFPFVRLALVRYQRMSLLDKELSPVVLADITQTVPDRLLSLVREPNDQSNLRLTLRGPAPTVRRVVDGRTITGTNLVTAQIEQQVAGINDETLGWTMLGEETVLAGTVEAGNKAVWTGVVTMARHDAGALRLVVQEFELHPGDDAAGGFSEVRRLVYVDVQTL